ncbi:MAG: tRNA (guanine-N(1)-)-methyltransferase [Candidatus Hepatoplasma scabrum]|nr:MAG: tRNA (guanine-N(1)-)-methyltransferase [Candidatus Hepatoplasma sp.]
MKITFITLFPEYFTFFKNHSIIKRAIENKKIKIELLNPRDFTKDKNRQVDDYIYGGGAGMLMLIEPIVKAIEKVKNENSFVILTSPRGRKFSQELAKKIAITKKELIIICGHYEGIDARIKHFIDLEISLGEFILTGGEIVAMAISDAIIRLIPDVINKDSLIEESFENNLIETDHYTKPQVFRNYSVPDVLLSGDHKKILAWRKESAIKNTKLFKKNNQKW